MSDDTQNVASGPVGTVLGSTAGGLSALHALPARSTGIVAPSTEKQFDTLRALLCPFACWRVEDFRFVFDSSFVDAGARDDFCLLADLMTKHAGALCTIYGHADPVGDDVYNKKLSGRRAKAIYGALTRKVEFWEELYSQPHGGDDWSNHAVQKSLMALGYLPGPGPASIDPRTRDEVKRFQETNGLAVDGIPGKYTRQVLFERYMDFLCTPQFKLKDENFLGAGKDPNGKADYQGCGEYNPVLMFSQEEKQEFDKPENRQTRNAENAPNRRVIIYLFRAGTKINISRWPCSRANEGGSGCEKRFWSDAGKRRSFQENRREYDKTRDTFACRFYDRLASRSPCEAGLKVFRIRLLDPMAQPIAYAPYRVSAEAHQTEGKADAEGWAAIKDIKVPGKATVEWGYRPLTAEAPPALIFSSQVYMDVDAPDEETAADRRLHNLGYRIGNKLEDRIKSFQRAYGILESGQLTDIKEDLWKYHDEANPEPLPNAIPEEPMEA